MYAGVDGCRKGWVALVLPEQRLVEGCTSFVDLVARLTELGVTVIGVDMPIGPPEHGARECDVAVRTALGSKRSSLFMTPTRAALGAPTQAEATRINRELGGAGVSAQAFALRHKIREVDEVAVPGLIEVHPELTFHLLGSPRFSKRTWAGVRERVTILRAFGLDPWAWDSQGWAAVDDTLDAAAAAITAMRYGEDRAIAYPADRTGPCIWA
jgi:predicted RNase H-like nuclease